MLKGEEDVGGGGVHIGGGGMGGGGGECPNDRETRENGKKDDMIGQGDKTIIRSSNIEYHE